MGRIADITARLGLDSSGFKNGLTKSKANVKSFVSSATRSFALLAGAAGFGMLTRSAIESANAIGDMADRLGIASDELQDFVNAGKQANIDQKVSSMGLQRFTRRVAEAQNGTGELKTTLERYGIAVKNMDGTNRTARAVLGDLADAMKNAKTGGERLAIAFKAFDTEGADLVRILGQGKDAFEEFVTTGNDQFGKFDKGAIENLRNAKTEIDKFKSKMTIMAGEVIAVVVPAMRFLVEALGVVGDAFGTAANHAFSFKSFMVSIAKDPRGIKDNYREMWRQMRKDNESFDKGASDRAVKAKDAWKKLNGDMVNISKGAGKEIEKSGVGGTDSTGGTTSGSATSGGPMGLGIERGEFEARNPFLRRQMKARNAHLTLNEKLRTQAMTGESAGITDDLIQSARGNITAPSGQVAQTSMADSQSLTNIATDMKTVATELTRTQ